MLHSFSTLPTWTLQVSPTSSWIFLVLRRDRTTRRFVRVVAGGFERRGGRADRCACPSVGAKSSGDEGRCDDSLDASARNEQTGYISCPAGAPNLFRALVAERPNSMRNRKSSSPNSRASQDWPVEGGIRGVCLCPPLPAAQALQAPCTNRARVEVGLWSVCCVLVGEQARGKEEETRVAQTPA